MLTALLAFALISLSASLLYLETVTHQEFLLHVAAIPLELLIGAIIIQRFVAVRDRRRKLKQLSFIKGYLFRFEMRDIFRTNFASLAEPQVSLNVIRAASTAELLKMRADFVECEVKHTSPEALGSVLDQYVESQRVFDYFMQWAIQNDFESIFRGMIYVLNFIQDIKVLKDAPLPHSVAEEVLSKPELNNRAKQVVRDNILSFLDYVIELKQSRFEEFAELLNDYERPEGQVVAA